MNETTQPAVAGPVDPTDRPTNDADVLAELLVQRGHLLRRLDDVQSNINAARARITETKKRARLELKRPKPSRNHRDASMALAAIEGATVAQVASKFEISSWRALECINRAIRMSMKPSRWAATGGAEHPLNLRAARRQPEPLASVLRKILEEE